MSKELAKWLHDNYEDIAKKENWNTQENCKVEFDNLPEANKKTMLEIGRRLYIKIQEQTENKSQIWKDAYNTGYFDCQDRNQKQRQKDLEKFKMFIEKRDFISNGDEYEIERYLNQKP